VFEAWETASNLMVDTAKIVEIVQQIDDPLLARRTGYMIEHAFEKSKAAQAEFIRNLASKDISSDTTVCFPLITSMPYKTHDTRWKLLVP
jgi:hypothetical protein